MKGDKAMKKLIVVIAMLLVLAMPCWAESLSVGETLVNVSDKISQLPPLKQGLMYDINDSKISYLSTIEVANWKNITLEAGYSQENKIMAVISYPLLKLADFGVTMPILKYIEANIGYGIGVDNLFDRGCEMKQGITLTLISIKW